MPLQALVPSSVLDMALLIARFHPRRSNKQVAYVLVKYRCNSLKYRFHSARPDLAGVLSRKPSARPSQRFAAATFI